MNVEVRLQQTEHDVVMKLNNTYFILRHGEARSNKEQFVSSWPEKKYNPLTRKGRKQIQELIPKFKKENIDLIFSSDLLRCKQTAEMVAKESGLKINFDKRLREHNVGIFNNTSVGKWVNFMISHDRFKERPPKGENWSDIKKRVKDFLREAEKKYKDKKILIISHGDVLLSFRWIVKNLSNKQVLENRNKLRLDQGELRKL